MSRFRLLASMTLSAAEGRALHERLLRQEPEPRRGVLAGLRRGDSTQTFAAPRGTAPAPVCVVLPRSRAANAYRELAEKVDAWPLPANPRGHLEFFVERLIFAQAAPRPARP